MNITISKKGIITLLAIALLLRLGYWSFLKQPKYSADTPKYLYCAKMLASGDIKEIFGQWPLHQLYPLLLSPMHIFNMPEAAYIKFLHIILSVLTVFLLYWAGRLLISHKYGLWVAGFSRVLPKFYILAALYPYRNSLFIFPCLIYSYISNFIKGEVFFTLG